MTRSEMVGEKDVMVDLETLGRGAGCVVLSIGAVAFDYKTGKLGEEFHQVIRTLSCLDVGLYIDPETEAWWEKQPEEARKVVKQAKAIRGNKILSQSLGDFNKYLHKVGLTNCRIWGNGSDFDNAILLNCYAATGIAPNWEFYNNRCFRTLKALEPDIRMERHGVYHNALDDAKTQALHAIKVLRKIKGLKSV